MTHPGEPKHQGGTPVLVHVVSQHVVVSRPDHVVVSRCLDHVDGCSHNGVVHFVSQHGYQHGCHDHGCSHHGLVHVVSHIRLGWGWYHRLASLAHVASHHGLVHVVAHQGLVP